MPLWRDATDVKQPVPRPREAKPHATATAGKATGRAEQRDAPEIATSQGHDLHPVSPEMPPRP